MLNSLGQSGPGSNANKGLLRIPQISSITGISSSDCFVSYPGYPLGVMFALSLYVKQIYLTYR